MNRTEQHVVLEVFSRTLARESHNLRQRPDLLWQQMYNRLQWEKTPAVREAIQPEYIRRTTYPPRPWAHNLIRPKESAAIVITLTGHTGAVNSAAFSPDGRMIVSASDDKTLRLWDVKTGKEMLIFRGHTNRVNSATFSPDGKRIASSSDDETIKVWNASGMMLFTLTGHDGPVEICAFSPDGKKIISASRDNTIKIWSAITGKEIRTIITNHQHGVRACAISPDGKSIVSAGHWSLTIWDTKTGEMVETITGFEKSVRACAFSPDGSKIVSTGWDSILHIRDAKTGHIILKIPTGHTLPANACSYYPDGKRIISASDDKTLKVWDAVSGDELFTLEGHVGPIKACVFSPDGQKIVSASEDGTVKVWYFVEGVEKKEAQDFAGHNTSVKACIFSLDGTKLFSASDDSILVWDPKIGRISQVVLRRQVDPWLEPITCAFSSDGKRIVAGNRDGSLDIWENVGGIFGNQQRLRSSSDQKNKKKLVTSNKAVTACAFSLDGKKIVVGKENGSLTILDSTPKTLLHKLLNFFIFAAWDRRTRWTESTFPGHKGAVTTCVFSPDGKRIISSGWDFKLWDIKNKKEMLALPGSRGRVTPCAFSTDGKKVVFVSETTLKVLDGETGQEIQILPGHRGTALETCSFSPDGKRVASAGWDKSIKIWDIESGKEIDTLTGHQGQVTRCAFFPHGRQIASSSKDSTLRVWNTATGKDVLTFIALGPVNCLAFNPLDNQICCGDDSRNVYLLKLIGLDS